MTRFEDLPPNHERQIQPLGAFTLDDLITAVDADTSLSTTRRRDLKSAIRAFCKRLHIVPSATPASMDYVRKRIQDIHPTQIGLKAKRWQNILSDLRFAISAYGNTPIHKLRAVDLPAPWRALCQHLPAPGIRYGLSRFIKFCAITKIDPESVDAATIDAFAVWIADHTLCRNPARSARDAARCWNKAVDTIPDWPGTPITLTPAREPYCPNWNDLPETFRVDAEAWLASLSVVNWADETAPLRPLKATSITTRQFQVKQSCGALKESGQDLDGITNLAFLVMPAQVERILTFFWNRSGEKPSSQAHGIAHCLLAIARHHVRLGADDIRKLQRMKRRVTPRTTGLTSKNRATLRLFDDDRNKERLLMFPTNAMARAKRMSNRAPHKAALLAQSALAVEILTMMPIRLRNLAELHLEWNFDWRGDRLFIVIPPAAVKNHEPIEFQLLGPSVDLFRTYREQFLPHLDNGSGYLLPGSVANKHKNQTHLSRQITKALFDATGLRVTPHQFRHIAAKIWLDDNPGSYEVVRRVLHHRSIDTTTKSYTGFETRSAALQYDRFVLEQRRRFVGIEDDSDE